MSAVPEKLNKQPRGVMWWVAGIAATAILIGWLSLTLAPATPEQPAEVRIERSDGHGSGVHIGDGLVLTAAHVARDAGEMKLVTADGASRPATALWISPVFDVALLYASPDGIADRRLSCAAPKVGGFVTAYGNPLVASFVQTNGFVMSVDDAGLGVFGGFLVDLTILPGMSGGPVVDQDGDVIGISVAGMTYGQQLVGIGAAISGKTICRLMGRS